MDQNNYIEDKLAELDKVLSEKKRIKALFPNQRASEQPIAYIDVDTQDEVCLTMKTGEHITRGIPSTFALTLGVLFSVIAYYSNNGNTIEYLVFFCGIFTVFFLAPLLWDLFSPMPYPVIFNRRSQEVYAHFKGELYHIRWDRARAIAYEDKLATQYTGMTEFGYLEVLLQGYNDPDKWIWANLSMPLGRTIETQSDLWEYLRSYMNNGPWFDEQGNTSVKDDYNRQQLSYSTPSTLDNLREAKNKVIKDDAISKILYYLKLLCSPVGFAQEWIYAFALKRSVRAWPKEVQERLKPNGPTTSLTDLLETKHSSA